MPKSLRLIIQGIMETILKTVNLTKVYGRRTVVDGVSMTINKGDIYGFIGKNGAGKTTFMRTVLSLTSITSGKVELFGGKKIEEVGNKIGSLIEAPGLYKNATAYENLKRFSILYGADESKINNILKFVNLDKTGKKKAKDFSLGMRQRLGIAIALLGEPEFLVLDEPINGLDPAGIKEIRDVISNVDTETTKKDKKLSKKELAMNMELIEKEMREAARNLDFERAMELRDILFEMKSN